MGKPSPLPPRRNQVTPPSPPVAPPDNPDLIPLADEVAPPPRVARRVVRPPADPATTVAAARESPPSPAPQHRQETLATPPIEYARRAMLAEQSPVGRPGVVTTLGVLST